MTQASFEPGTSRSRVLHSAVAPHWLGGASISRAIEKKFVFKLKDDSIIRYAFERGGLITSICIVKQSSSETIFNSALVLLLFFCVFCHRWRRNSHEHGHTASVVDYGGASGGNNFVKHWRHGSPTLSSRSTERPSKIFGGPRPVS